MATAQGDFIWYELLTTDAKAAFAFYSAVLGWTQETMEIPNGTYLICKSGERQIGGLMDLPPEALEGGARPCWVGYIAVEDVDAAVAAVVDNGGAVHMPAMDLPEVGRFAMIADPQGAVFYVMRTASEGENAAFGSEPGQWNWNELSTSDPKAALDFYCARFGWTKGDAMPMGEMGDYQMLNHGDRMIGAMRPGAPDGPPPHWLFYYGVADIDAALSAVTANGGTVMHGPEEIPGGSYIIVVADPQGAPLGMVGPRQA